MAEWILDIYEENLEHILNDSKEVEGRVPDIRKSHKCYQNIVPGDMLTFRIVDGSAQPLPNFDLTSFEVSYNKKYDSAREYLEAEGLKRALPEAKDINQGIHTYHQFPGYEERIAQVGIHAIGLGKKL